MLVKQVFSRFMGVWIFAVALLVGEVFCIKPEEVSQAGMAANSINKKLLDDRIIFMELMKGKCSGSSFKGDIVRRLRPILDKVDGFLRSISAVSKLNLKLSPLYEPNDDDALEIIWAAVPQPLVPNLVQIVRVQALEKSLEVFKTGLKKIQERLGRKTWQKFLMRDGIKNLCKRREEISDLIHLFDELPFSYDNVLTRGAHLSKKKTEVLWEELKDLHDAMNEALRKYIPTKDGHLPTAVVVHFLKCQRERGGIRRIDTAILTALTDLYKKNRLYRLAASEEHTISVEGCPNLLAHTRLLQKTVQKLERFANALRTKDVKEYWEQDEDAILLTLDPTLENLHFSVVYNLRSALNHPPLRWLGYPSDKQLAPSEAEGGIKEFIGKFLRVFYEVEEMSYFHEEYALLTNLAQKGAIGRRDKFDINLRFLVAFMDQKLKQLIEKLTSDTVTDTLCPTHRESSENALVWATSVGVAGQLGALCDLRDQAQSVDNDTAAEPFERSDSFYSYYRGLLIMGSGEDSRVYSQPIEYTTNISLPLNETTTIFIHWSKRVRWLKNGLYALHAKKKK